MDKRKASVSFMLTELGGSLGSISLVILMSMYKRNSASFVLTEVEGYLEQKLLGVYN